jgi:hypothetical protein
MKDIHTRTPSHSDPNESKMHCMTQERWWWHCHTHKSVCSCDNPNCSFRSPEYRAKAYINPPTLCTSNPTANMLHRESIAPHLRHTLQSLAEQVSIHETLVVMFGGDNT